MKVEKTNIEGLLIIQPDVFKDERGYFFESFSKKKYREIGITYDFVQDNISKSMKRTIRGLHYQVGEFVQGKLVSVIEGKVLDVAVDVRFGSPTFGEYQAVEVSSENKLQFWIPPGFAHGFAVISDEAIFHYKCTNLYSKQHERSIIYNDPEIGIDWRIENPIVSDKDLHSKRFNEIQKDFIYENSGELK